MRIPAPPDCSKPSSTKPSAAPGSCSKPAARKAATRRSDFPSPLVGEGAEQSEAVRGSLRGKTPLIRHGLRIADAKHRRPVKERRPEAAYGHPLPPGGEGRGGLVVGIPTVG